jgi:hypothetical protein
LTVEFILLNPQATAADNGCRSQPYDRDGNSSLEQHRSPSPSFRISPVWHFWNFAAPLYLLDRHDRNITMMLNMVMFTLPGGFQARFLVFVALRRNV